MQSLMKNMEQLSGKSMVIRELESSRLTFGVSYTTTGNQIFPVEHCFALTNPEKDNTYVGLAMLLLHKMTKVL